MTALHTDEYRRFCEALARARLALGLSQYDLADRLGVDQSFVSKYEDARRRLDVIEFLRIAQALELKPGEFLAGLGPEVGSFATSRARTPKPRATAGR
jgi:transcriptional regulator with XRE-family HTH domain